jgi:glycerol uptake facilitator-like aquaporin
MAAFRRTAPGEYLAEVIGTFVLICFGDGVVAMAVAALNQSGRGTQIFQASGDWLIIGWGWGLAVTFGIYVAGGISGAHINPAVTIAFAARRDFPWRKVPGYIAAQMIGAFLGAFLVYIVYKGAIDSYEHANHITRGDPNSVPTYSIFATFPAKYLGNWVARSSTRSSARPSSWRSCSRSSTSSTSRPEGTWRRGSSASSWSRSDCRSAPTRVTRSTPRATSDRGSSR